MIREHPRFQSTAIIFVSAIHMTRDRPAARLRGRRGRLRAGAGGAGGAARQGEGVRRALPQDAAARGAQRRAGKRASPSAPPSSKLPTARLLQSEQRRSLALAAGDMGSWDSTSPATRWTVGRRPVPHLRRRSRRVRADLPDSIRDAIHPDDVASIRRCREKPVARTVRPIRSNSASCGPTARCAGASAAAVASFDATGAHDARQRRHHRHHRPQGRREASGAARARGRSPRAQRSRHRAGDRPPRRAPTRSRTTCRPSRAASGRWRRRTSC